MNRIVIATCLGLTMIAPAPDAAAESADAVSLLQAYIRVDTVNPPGNESRAVDFFAKILDAEGIAYETAESAPGRGNIWARLEGGGAPALMLLNHTDVVPADRAHWTIDPLSGEVRDGFVYGRGALDMKSTGILQFVTFLALHRAGRPLNRDVVFMATADEEAGGLFGAGWIVANRPKAFAGVGLVLNEGGAGGHVGARVAFTVEVTQKVPVWLRLRATDQPSHGSTPRATSAVTRLLDALDRIRGKAFAPRIVPAVDAYFKAVAALSEGADRKAFANIAEAVGDDEFLRRLQIASPRRHALTRDTCSITRLEGSSKINVVPPEATAELDCRILPDRAAEEFVDAMRARVHGLGVEIEVIMAFTPAVSPTDTPLYGAIAAVIGRNFPDAVVIPGVATGFTDSHFFRDLGIPSYGFTPVIIDEGERARVHGNDERISVENMTAGARLLREIVEGVVYD